MIDDLRLDHPRRPVLDLADMLRGRLAAMLGVEASRIVLAPTAESFALVGLDPAQAVHIGRPASPLCAFVSETPEPASLKVEATLSETVVRAGLDTLTPAAGAHNASRSHRLSEALRVAAEAFRSWPEVEAAEVDDGVLRLSAPEPIALRRKLAAAGIVAAQDDNRFTLFVSNPQAGDALAERLAVHTSRSVSVRRTTKETDIAVSLDLDADGPVRADTGIEFFDHMLDQVGRHGGFALDVTAEGDVGVDAHHTIEDVCLTLGDALRQALGEKRGIARFGFELPMDETRAGVWIDLSGRPFCKFEGDIPGERVAGFPVEMTTHAFRSLAEAMKASIHVRVEGENAHHMIEACFKAFGRALRQALRVEGDAIPSTKGAL